MRDHSYIVVASRQNNVQGWRRSVKARHLVMTLRDYFIEKATTGGPDSPKGPESWALQYKYINIGRARSIMEASDGDGSGFVTVSEVNHFTQLRPLEWRCVFAPRVYRVLSVHPDHSLPHWLLYWAIGSLP